jgi:hypothetical protein
VSTLDYETDDYKVSISYSQDLDLNSSLQQKALPKESWWAKDKGQIYQKKKKKKTFGFSVFFFYFYLYN